MKQAKNSYNPCRDNCFVRLGEQYKKETCSGKCEFADVCEERDKLKRFKEYFDDLYEQGLEIANWHLSGATEPFDTFYENALKEMENTE